VHEIWNHYVHIDDGQYDPKGGYPSHQDEVEAIVQRLVEGEDGTPPKHLLLYAHGGLNAVEESASRVGKWRKVFRDNGIAELHFIWETGLMEELRDVLLGKEKFTKERVAGISSWWDKTVEKASQPLGYPLWGEMRSDADIAFNKTQHAGSHFLATLKHALAKAGANAPKLHLVGHSAGSIWIGHLLERWQALGGAQIDKLILFAPACSSEFFMQKIAPAIKNDVVAALHHFLLDDEREQDDNVAEIYRKSLLYLVSRAFQDRDKIVPLLGMEKYLPQTLDALKALGIDHKASHYNTRDNSDMTRSNGHGEFDNDQATMNAMLKLVLGGQPMRPFAKEDLTGY
jgi:pimeloyl-ACP methyl ester carboxylesterase